MKRFIVALISLILLVAGCSREKKTDAGRPRSVAAKTDKSEPAKTKKESPPPKPSLPPLNERLFGRFKLEDWPERIKNVDPNGHADDETVDGLIALVIDHEVPLITRRQAALTLGRIGRVAGEMAERAVPVLVRLLRENGQSDHPHDVDVTLLAIKALSLLRASAKPATEQLAALLTGSSRPVTVQAACMEALAQIGEADPKAVHALISMLTFRFARSGDRADRTLLRGYAIDAIALVGPSASAAIPPLIDLTRRGNEDLRRKAAAALGAVGRGSRDAVTPLAELLTMDDSPAVRDAAAIALGKVGEEAVPALIRLLTDDDVGVRYRAASALGLVDSPAKAVIADLDNALDDDDGRVRIAAAESLWKLTAKPDAVVPALIEELKNPDRRIRIKSYRLFQELGPKAASAVGPLEKLLKDERGYVRLAASKALRSIRASR